jgi:hypothetical protein
MIRYHKCYQLTQNDRLQASRLILVRSITFPPLFLTFGATDKHMDCHAGGSQGTMVNLYSSNFILKCLHESVFVMYEKKK